mgnify:CR=1 FL=1
MQRRALLGFRSDDDVGLVQSQRVLGLEAEVADAELAAGRAHGSRGGAAARLGLPADGYRIEPQLAEVTLKVLPRPVAEETLVFAMDEGEALRRLNASHGGS